MENAFFKRLVEEIKKPRGYLSSGFNNTDSFIYMGYVFPAQILKSSEVITPCLNDGIFPDNIAWTGTSIFVRTSYGWLYNNLTDEELVDLAHLRLTGQCKTGQPYDYYIPENGSSVPPYQSIFPPQAENRGFYYTITTTGTTTTNGWPTHYPMGTVSA